MAYRPADGGTELVLLQRLDFGGKEIPGVERFIAQELIQ